jgi:hypothetical protein
MPDLPAEGVGLRRCEETTLAALTMVTDTSRALVPFPEAGLLGTVTGFAARLHIDTATVFTAANIAHHMTVLPQGTASPSPPTISGQLGE